MSDEMIDSREEGARELSRWFVLAGVLLLAVASLGATCGGMSGASSGCLVDADCMSDELCVQGICRVSCDDDGDCSVDFTCQSVFRAEEDGAVDVCQPRMSANNGRNNGNNNGGTCISDAECRMMIGDKNAVCDVDRQCAVPEPVYGVLIRDVTIVDLETDPEDGGLGADIAAVYLADDEGNPVAYGDTIVIRPANDVVSASTVDGNPPSLNSDKTCTDGSFSDDATPLGGDGGHLLVRFLDNNGETYREPPEQWNLVVIEWGANCPGGDVTTQDEYELSLCVASSAEEMDVDDCKETIGGPLSGKAVLTDFSQ